MTIQFLRDRAAVIATAVLQIVESFELKALDNLHLQLEQYLRDEIADLAREIATDRESPDV